MKASLVAVLLSAILVPAETFSPDADGYIRNWLVLAPIAVQEDSGATEIDKDLLGGEATIKPKPDEKVNISGKILTWKPHQAPDICTSEPRASASRIRPRTSSSISARRSGPSAAKTRRPTRWPMSSPAKR